MTTMVTEGRCPICHGEARRHFDTNTKDIWYMCPNCGSVDGDISTIEIYRSLGLSQQDLNQEPALLEDTVESTRKAVRRGDIQPKKWRMKSKKVS